MKEGGYVVPGGDSDAESDSDFVLVDSAHRDGDEAPQQQQEHHQEQAPLTQDQGSEAAATPRDDGADDDGGADDAAPPSSEVGDKEDEEGEGGAVDGATQTDEEEVNAHLESEVAEEAAATDERERRLSLKVREDMDIAAKTERSVSVQACGAYGGRGLEEALKPQRCGEEARIAGGRSNNLLPDTLSRILSTKVTLTVGQLLLQAAILLVGYAFAVQCGGDTISGAAFGRPLGAHHEPGAFVPSAHHSSSDDGGQANSDLVSCKCVCSSLLEGNRTSTGASASNQVYYLEGKVSSSSSGLLPGTFEAFRARTVDDKDLDSHQHSPSYSRTSKALPRQKQVVEKAAMCMVPGQSKSRDRLLPLPPGPGWKVKELSQRADALKHLLSECQEESDFWFEKWLDAQKGHAKAGNFRQRGSQCKYNSPWAAADHRVRMQRV